MFAWTSWVPHGFALFWQAAGVAPAPTGFDARLLAESALGAVGVVSWYTIRKTISTAEEVRGLRSLLIGEEHAPGILSRMEQQLQKVTDLSQESLTKSELIQQDVARNTGRIDALEQQDRPMKGQRTHE